MIALHRVRGIAEAAGGEILSVYGARANSGEVQVKDDESPFTLAGRLAHEHIVKALAAVTPDVPVISEVGDSTAPIPARCWVVDALDGTKEFHNRTGEFTVNIAFVEEGRPVLGVVHAPALGVSWVGGPYGASRCAAGKIARIRAHPCPDLATLRIVASKDQAGPLVTALFERLPRARAVSLGSSLKFCLLADGRADLYLPDGPTMAWDTAAAQAVLEAAGGAVVTHDGHPLKYGESSLRNAPFAAVGSLDLRWQVLFR
jgi:3'(2'), 5'-bisphosphate nucleotidase